MTAAQTQAASQDFVLTRTFDAPRELVWKAFTDVEHIRQWWGPKGFKVTAARMDLRVGGFFHYGMVAPDGAPMWGKFVFREIVPQQRIVFVNSFSDETGATARHAGHIDWPLEMLTTFTFEALPGGKTRFTTRMQALNATPAEQKTFDDNHISMRQGWTGTLDSLDAFLPKLG